MADIQHPLKKGVRVKYLSPRCPCSGKRFVQARGKIIGVTTKQGGATVIYTIQGEKNKIPAAGIMEVLNK